MTFNLIDQLQIIFNYIFSSFLGLELFIFVILFTAVLILNIFYDYKIIKVCSLSLMIAFIIGIFIFNRDYVIDSISLFIKFIIEYIYFPSILMYFLIIVAVTIYMIINMYSTKISKRKKIFNYSVFSILYFCFFSFLAISIIGEFDLSNESILYQDEVILALIQVSNLFLFSFIIFDLIYHLYKFLQKKDKE